MNNLILVLCGAAKKDSSAQILPSHRTYAALHAAIRTDDRRDFDGNDLPDLEHAAVAAAYCDLFLTERSLSDLLSRAQVRAVIPKNCTALSSINDAIAKLR